MVNPKSASVPHLMEQLDRLVFLFSLPDVRQALYAKNLLHELNTREAAIGGVAQCMARVRIFKRIGVRCCYWKKVAFDAEFTARPDGDFDLWEKRCEYPSVVTLSEITAWLTVLLEIPEKQPALELLSNCPTSFDGLHRIMHYINNHACDHKSLRVNTWLLGYVKFCDALEIEINTILTLFGCLEIVGDTENFELTVTKNNGLIITGNTLKNHSIKMLPSEFEAWWNNKVKLD